MTLIISQSRRLTCTILAATLAGACGDSGGSTDDATEPGATSDATEGSSGATDPGTTTADEPTGAGSTDATTGDVTTADATTTDATTDATTADPTADPTTGDPTSGGVADCGFDPAVVYGRTEPIFQLVSADGETCVWLRRRDDSEPDIIYKAVPYTLLEFKAGHDGAVEHFTDEAMLSWESTHHNWADVAEAWDAGVRYRLEDWYAQDDAFLDRYGLFAYDAQTDALLWGPVELTPYAP
jgi:hypothetical protein